MTYLDQKQKWLAEHPDAKADVAWEAGYLQCLKNWCNKKR
jgi:hypothetical protein